MTTLILSKKEKIKADRDRYHAANSEKIKASMARYQAANSEKIKAYKAKYIAANPSSSIFNNIQKKYNVPRSELNNLIPQDLIDVKILQLTLHRLIKEKGWNNVPARMG